MNRLSDQSMIIMVNFRPLIIIVLLAIVLLRCEASRYDGSGRIYPWPLPADRKAIFFSLIVSFGENFNSSGVVPGVNVALDIINSNDSNLLNGYSLHYILSDSKCQKTPALDAFFHQILAETRYQKLAVIGAGCSPATEPTAEISHQFNITQLSCASTSPVLSDRTRFRRYFQLLPSMVDIANGYVGVFRLYGWRHVTLIVQEENLFTEMTRRLKELLTDEDANNRILYREDTFSTNIGLSDLKVLPFSISEERIYVIATYENYARALLCEAVRRGVHYPTHLLLTFQWYEERWWLKESGVSDHVNLTCTPEERESVLMHSLAFNFVLSDYLKNKDVTTDVGITGAEYLSKEKGQLGVAPHYFSRSLYAQYCFDATLTLAYALNQTMADISDSEVNSRLASAYGLPNGTLFGLEDFNYRSDALTNITFGHLSNTSFNGITRDVSFNTMGIRITKILSVHQLRIGGDGLNWVEIGTFVMLEDSSGLSGNVNAIWPNGVPYDGVPGEDIQTAFIPLVVVIYLLAAAGILFAIACLAFNYIFRNRKLIRLSSPKLNNIIVLGVVVLYTAAVLFAIPTQSESVVSRLCVARLWFLSLGVSLAFGTIIMKMFRVYLIFSNPTPKRKKFFQDWMLAVVVLIMVIVDLLVLVVFSAVVGGLNLQIVERVIHRENPQTVEGDVKNVTKHYILICQSTAERVAVGILSVYKGLLQILAFFLAICIPRVKVKGLNDAKYIVAAVYVSSLGLLLSTLTHFTLTDYINIHTALFAFALLFSGTAILGLLFIPKMIGLYKDPKGENVFSDTHTGDIASAGIVGSLQLQRGTTAFGTEDTLRKRIRELEGVLSSYQSNENVLTIGGSEDGLGVDDGSSVTRSAAATDWKQSGRWVVSKDVNATTVTV